MRRSVRDVLDRLRAEGLDVPGVDESARAALAPEMRDHMPWYLRTIVGFAAWIATAFLLFSLIAVAGLRGEGARIVVGIALMGAAVFAKREMQGEFMRWAAIAMALAGQGFVLASVASMSESPTVTALAALAMSVVLILVIDDAVLRFLLTLSAGAALIMAFVASKTPQGYDIAVLVLVAVGAWAWRHDVARRPDRLAETLEPIAYGLVVVLFASLLARTLAVSALTSMHLDTGRDFSELGALATIACTAALVALTWKILDERDLRVRGRTGVALLAGAVALGFGTLDSPGILAGVTVLILAFDRRDRVLLAMATVFLLVFGSLYYYSLHLTLMEKSGILVASGVLLLAIRGKLPERSA